MRQADPARSRLAREKRHGGGREAKKETARTAELAPMSLCPITNKAM